MRIQILKKGNRVQGSEPCPWIMECPPEANKK